MEEFCRILPKVELHAHLNGSLSNLTLEKLARLKGCPVPDIDLDQLTIDQVFDAFRQIQKLTDTKEAVTLATYLTLGEFAADNVKYIELRSTPRSTWYGQAVLDGIKQVSPTR